MFSLLDENQSYNVWTCRVKYFYQFKTYYFWQLEKDSEYGVFPKLFDNRFWQNDVKVKKVLLEEMAKNKKDAEYDPWLLKHEKWAKDYKFTSYKDMCDYWIKNKNAPLLGGEMEEIVKGKGFAKVYSFLRIENIFVIFLNTKR